MQVTLYLLLSWAGNRHIPSKMRWYHIFLYKKSMQASNHNLLFELHVLLRTCTKFLITNFLKTKFLITEFLITKFLITRYKVSNHKLPNLQSCQCYKVPKLTKFVILKMLNSYRTFWSFLNFKKRRIQIARETVGRQNNNPETGI